jgi:lysyl-tRNA synthetase class 2
MFWWMMYVPTMKPEGAGKASVSEAAPDAPDLSICACPTCPNESWCAAQNGEPAPEVKIDFSKVEIEPLFADYVAFEDFSKCDFRAVKVKACEAVKKSDKLLRFTLDDGSGTDRQILSGIRKFYEPETLVGKTLLAIVNLPPRKMMGLESCGMLISAVHKENGEEKLDLVILDDAIPAGAKMC